MFMINKIKAIGAGLKSGFKNNLKPSTTPIDAKMVDTSAIDTDSKERVKRKIKFEDQIDEPIHILNTSDPDDTKNMKLKRLFKSRAKKLIERAESLTRDQFDDMLDDYDLKNSEEEKEIKMIDPKIRDFKKLPSPTGSVENFDISLDLKGQNMLAKNLIPEKIDKKVTIEETKDVTEEDKKGDLSDEEFKKFRAERNKLCGIKRSKSFSNKEEFERSLKDFTCTICMEYMVGTKKLTCGHCFCDECISFWFLREKVCPICREKARDGKNITCNLVDFTIEHILSKAYQNDSSMLKDLRSWQKRRKKYFKFKESHKVKNVKIGDKLDVRDTEYIWCTGSVEKILKSKYRYPDLLYVHYDGWNRCYDEYIPSDSDRIAPISLYTSRNDIPKYTRHEGPDDRVYGNVVEGGENNNNNANNNNNEENNEVNEEQNNDNGQEQNADNNNEPEEPSQPNATNNESTTQEAGNNESSRPSPWTADNLFERPNRAPSNEPASNPFTVFSRRNGAASSRTGNNPFTRAREGIELRLTTARPRPPSRYSQRNQRNNAEAPPPRRDLDSSLTSLTRLFDESTHSLLSSTRALMRDLVQTSRINRRQRQAAAAAAASASNVANEATTTEQNTNQASGTAGEAQTEANEAPSNAQNGDQNKTEGQE